MVLHKHLLLRAEVRKPITDPEMAKDWLTRLVAEIGMVITKSGGPHADYVDKPDNCGIAAFAMIETSHCSVHIWDRQTPPLVQLDVYSCASFEPHKVLKILEEMDPIKVDGIVVNRAKTIGINEVVSVEENPNVFDDDGPSVFDDGTLIEVE